MGKRGRKPLCGEDERMRAYNRGLTDKEMGIELGMSRETICRWRLRRGLKPNPGPQQTNCVPMEEALTPDQCVVMRRFFRDLRQFARQTKGTPDVLAFMKEWRRQYRNGEIKC